MCVSVYVLTACALGISFLLLHGHSPLLLAAHAKCKIGNDFFSPVQHTRRIHDTDEGRGEGEGNMANATAATLTATAQLTALIQLKRLQNK